MDNFPFASGSTEESTKALLVYMVLILSHQATTAEESHLSQGVGEIPKFLGGSEQRDFHLSLEMQGLLCGFLQVHPWFFLS